MAYRLEFAPEVVPQLQQLTEKLRRKVLERLEQTARDATPEQGRTKRLKRLRVEDHRLVILELHSHERVYVLKVAGRHELHDRLLG